MKRKKNCIDPIQALNSTNNNMAPTSHPTPNNLAVSHFLELLQQNVIPPSNIKDRSKSKSKSQFLIFFIGKFIYAPNRF